MTERQGTLVMMFLFVILVVLWGTAFQVSHIARDVHRISTTTTTTVPRP